MKILKISALDLPDLVSIYPQSAEGVKIVRDKLKEMKFDLSRSYEVYRGINNSSYLFIQEDDTSELNWIFIMLGYDEERKQIVQLKLLKEHVI